MRSIHGIIHGRTIDLAVDPGIEDGSQVEVRVISPATGTEVCSPVPAMSIVLTVVLLLCSHVAAQAQLPQIRNLPQPSAEPEDDLQRLPTQRRVVQQLAELTTAAGKSDMETVRDLLGTLRAADPMLMVPEALGTFVPLHRDLILRIQSFSPEVIRELQLESPVADAALQRGLAGDGISGLISVLHRYSGTTASLKAHLLLAAMHGDRGHEQAAKYWLAPVLTNKTSPQLKATAEQFRSRFAVTTIGETAAGSDQPSQDQRPSDAEPPATKPEESSDSGTLPPDPPVSEADTRPEPPAAQDTDPARSVVNENLARHLHWMQSLPLPTKARRLSQDLVQGSPEHRMLPWSAWEPVVDDQKIYVRSPSTISAFDRRTGQHVWTRAINRKKDTLEEIEDDMPMFRIPRDENALNSALNSPEIQSLHRNELVGRMTSDDLRLFAVCQIVEATPLSSASGAIGAIPLRIMIGRGERLSAGLWELIAIDKESGRRLWTMGGPAVEERFGNELAMAWFAGPPAVCGHQLFGVVEKNGVIQLTCISAETGQLNWTIPLAYPEAEIAQDPARQILAARTHAEAGLVFTTTTTGWIFAADSVTRSILWARRLPATQTGTPSVRSFRNSAIFPTPTLPLSKVWRSESPHLCKGALVVSCSQSQQLLVLEPVSGKILFRTSADSATMALYADQEILIVASPNSTVAWRLPEMKELWTTTRNSRQAVPVGHGVKSGDHLLIPMSDGSLEVINPADGSSVASLAGLRPSFSTGGLFPAGNDVVSYGPNHLALLSSSPADRLEDPDPLEQAAFLVETGRLSDAREALSQIVVDALNAESVRRLRFRISVGLFASGDIQTELGLQEIASAAQTNEERALSHFLRLEQQLKSSPETAVQSLIDVLENDDAILSVEIPETSALYATLRTSTAENPLAVSSLKSGTATLRWPLRSWVLRQLQQLFAQADNDGKEMLLQSIGQLSDENLLGMHSADLASEYLRRAEGHVQSGALQETTLHLLSAAFNSGDEDRTTSDAAITPEATGRLTDIFDRIQTLADESRSNDPGQQAIVRQMLQVVRHERLLAAHVDSLTAPAAPRDAIADRWTEVGDPSYTMLPVSTVGQMSFRMPNVRPLETQSDDDLFLSAFDWSLRRDPGALIARSVTDQTIPQWSLKTTVAENPFFQSDEVVMRFGSVVVLQNMLGLSAFSVVDQRWLWSRRMPGGLRRTVLSLLNRPFKDFNAMSNADAIFGHGRRICGATDRWICLMSEGTLEVVDLLNGRRLWAMSGFEVGSSVFACDSVIFAFALRTENCFTLNPADGSATPLPARFGTVDVGMRSLCSSRDALVVWNSKTFANKERSIDWIDARTMDVIRSVELPDMEYAQFLNPETLVAVTDQQTFHVVSLKTGERQTLSFAKPDDDGRPAPVVQRIAVAADAVNYYIFEQEEGGRPMMPGSLYWLRAEPISKELLAVNRRTGTLAWARPAEDSMLACLRAASDPVMLIVRIIAEPQANPGPLPRLPFPAGQRYRIDGISRTTGNKLLTYPVVAQAPSPGLRLTRSREGQLNLEAFGNRVRFLPATAEVTPENN